MPYTLKTRRIKTKNPTTGLYEEFDASASPVVDSALSGVSENPVQNKVVKNTLDQKANISDLNGKVSKTDAVIDNSVSMGRLANSVVGQSSIALGADVVASGIASSAVGGSCQATGVCAHAEGASTVASGQYSHAENAGTTASGNKSHAEGEQSVAYGEVSHAEGYRTQSNGPCSHSEGSGNIANGNCVHVEGYKNTANGHNSHVQGKWSVADDNNVFCHIVGNGTDNDHRSNAHTLDWNGNAEFAGDVKANACGGQNPISLVNVAAALNKEIAVQSSQPSSSENKLWINPTGSGEIVVPTQAEMEAALNGKASVIGTPSDGQFLVYSSLASAYVPTTVPTASGVSF